MAKLSTAAKSGETSPSTSQTALTMSTRPGSLAAVKVLVPPIVRPHTAGAFKARKVEPTRFRYFLASRSLAVGLCALLAGVHGGSARTGGAVSLFGAQWDAGYARERRKSSVAMSAAIDTADKGEPHDAQPSRAVSADEGVTKTRALLSRVNCGDSIDYAQRRQENVGDLILETLNILENHGGPDAFVNMKLRCSSILTYLKATRGVTPFDHCAKLQTWTTGAMKSRPALTVVASDRDLDYKHREDDEDDKFEASCDIGETTLQKAGLRINSSGVTIADGKPGHKYDEDEVGENVVTSHSTRKLVALGQLETCSMIGRGSSGQVFKARHCETGALYAVKVVTNVFDKPRRDQILTEIRTLTTR
ncbi:hypothetical protein ON010_g4543 [Phytophthora cinnamomi]|nr:hypothetical protein ON010_g4543 [Phytophthora cinnamomi]